MIIPKPDQLRTTALDHITYRLIRPLASENSEAKARLLISFNKYVQLLSVRRCREGTKGVLCFVWHNRYTFIVAHYSTSTYACCPTGPSTWGRALKRPVWVRRSAGCWQCKRADLEESRADWASLCCWSSPVVEAARRAGGLNGATGGGRSEAPVEDWAGMRRWTWGLCTARQSWGMRDCDGQKGRLWIRIDVCYNSHVLLLYALKG